ncbi:MAG: cytochrome P450 [Actinobacteria bacterium]|nr:cytochrome P450 [Actinomycetota bacterium]NIS36310.1 cytochrome P450 [Actinomycetota bacterium]NIT98652.1 cytochrome P450 [Actinomycetota bacterium]NIU22268.1 cytochrome P450 [Actinomycetota bacterium]NIU70855.1 cytochrome P450 [Actinomycetota bacterium]
MTSPPPLDNVDLSDIEFWRLSQNDRAEVFRQYRTTDPFPFFDEPENPLGPNGPGYYVLTRHRDVVDASRQPELFCSGKGATGPLDQSEEVNDFFGSMINMDDPRHKRLRGLVSAGFTPRQLERAMDSVERVGRELALGLRGREGEFDFVEEFAALLPLRIICEMMGIPESQWGFVLEQSNMILGASDPDYAPEGGDLLGAVLGAGLALSQLMSELGEERTKEPTDDLTSALMNAEIDGERLTAQELASFFILLVVAGNETTRNAISWGLHLLTTNPDQRAVWEADFDGVAPTAVEEIVRLASPVISMRRTVTTDGAELGGRTWNEGDKLILSYWSANRDETVFDDPLRFDVRRTPNDHVGFGGPGPHFCLGAHLARREITVAFRELFAHVPTIHATGEPAVLRSSFINGVKRLPASLR